VPGLLEEKLVALIKSLPKSLRRHFVPAPDFARAARQGLTPGQDDLIGQFAAQLRRMTGIEVPADAWQAGQLPPHLSMNFHLIDANGKLLARGRDLEALKQAIGTQAVASFERLPTAQYERDNLVDWDVGELPEYVEIAQQGLSLRGYPAVVTDQDGIHLRLLDAPDKARAAHRAGVLALFRLRAAKSLRYLEKNLPGIQQMCLHYAAAGPCERLKSDLLARIAELALYGEDAAVPRDRSGFDAAAARGELALVTVGSQVCRAVGETLAEYHIIQKRIKGAVSPAWLAALGDIRDQLDHLVYAGFVLATPLVQLRHLPRYLKAISKRLDRLQQNPAKDRPLALQIEPHWQKCKQRLDAARKRGEIPEALRQYRWLIEEFRVSLFAQELGTAEKVSAKRLEEVARG